MNLWFLDASSRAESLSEAFPGIDDWFATSNPRLDANSVVFVHVSHFGDRFQTDKAVRRNADTVFERCGVTQDGVMLTVSQLAESLSTFRENLRRNGASTRLIWFSGDGISQTVKTRIATNLTVMLGANLPLSVYVEPRIARTPDAAALAALRSYLDAPGQAEGNAAVGRLESEADNRAAAALRDQAAAWLSLTENDYSVADGFAVVTARLRAAIAEADRATPDRITLERLRAAWVQRGLLVPIQPDPRDT